MMVSTVSTTDRKQDRVHELFKNCLENLPESEREKFYKFLMNNHTVFSLEDNERGETDQVMLEIDTGDAQPRKKTLICC